MKEKPFIFPNGSYNLFGILHEPEIESNGEGFVFCSPFAEEKLWAHRVFVNFARELARLGYTVLRFDYMGHGDSEGPGTSGAAGRYQTHGPPWYRNDGRRYTAKWNWSGSCPKAARAAYPPQSSDQRWGH